MPRYLACPTSPPNGSPSAAAAPRPTPCWPAASTSSIPARATCCCCGTAPAAASRVLSPARRSRCSSPAALRTSRSSTTVKLAEPTPTIIEAARAARKQAQERTRPNNKTAVDIYKEITGDKTSAEDLLAWLKEPGMMEWNLEPQGPMKFAAHLFKVGTLKTQPKAWIDYYLPIASDLKGN